MQTLLDQMPDTSSAADEGVTELLRELRDDEEAREKSPKAESQISEMGKSGKNEGSNINSTVSSDGTSKNESKNASGSRAPWSKPTESSKKKQASGGGFKLPSFISGSPSDDPQSVS